ncbi:hypothetical protein SAMN05443253_11567 [Bacillus sp. OK048]|nr:hypothetical protein SAMN05443253_11567 [Bacillus sp. OK048]
MAFLLRVQAGAKGMVLVVSKINKVDIIILILGESRYKK